MKKKKKNIHLYYTKIFLFLQLAFLIYHTFKLVSFEYQSQNWSTMFLTCRSLRKNEKWCSPVLRNTIPLPPNWFLNFSHFSTRVLWILVTESIMFLTWKARRKKKKENRWGRKENHLHYTTTFLSLSTTKCQYYSWLDQEITENPSWKKCNTDSQEQLIFHRCF